MGCLLLSSKFDFLLRVEKAENNCFDHVALMLLCKVPSGGKPVIFFFIQHNQSNPTITHRVVINCTSCAFDAVRVKYRSWSSVSVFVASTQVQNRLSISLPKWLFTFCCSSEFCDSQWLSVLPLVPSSMPHAREPAIHKPRIQQNDEELFSNPLLDVAVWNSARTWSRMCFSCVFACDAHVTLGPLQVLSERSAVDRQSGGQFLALSPCFVCWSAGMLRNVGLGQVERSLEETAIPDRSLHHIPPLHPAFPR